MLRKSIVAVLVLLLAGLTFGQAMATNTTTRNHNTIPTLNAGSVYISVSDTSIVTYNSSLILNTLPSTVAGLYLRSGVPSLPAYQDYNKKVQSFIDEYKKLYPDKAVIEYYFYIDRNGTIYHPVIYKGVDAVLIAPMDEKQLFDLVNKVRDEGFKGKILVTLNYIPVRDNQTNETTYQPSIPIDELIKLHDEGKIAGVVFPFYFIEGIPVYYLYNYGYLPDSIKPYYPNSNLTKELLNQMESDSKTLRAKGVITIGAVRPIIEFAYGEVDVPLTLNMIDISNKIFGQTIYIGWESSPVPLLSAFDPSLFTKTTSNPGHHIDTATLWKIGYGILGGIIIIFLIVAYAGNRKKNKKADKKKPKKKEEKKKE